MNDSIKNAQYLNLDAPNTETKASLCLYSEDIDVQTITKLLQCNPTEAHHKGDIIKRRPPAPIGIWYLDAPSNLSFPDKLKYLIDATISDQEVWDKLISRYKIELRCAIFLHSWTDGFVFPSNILEEIGKRRWEFGLSVYSAEGEEIVDAFLKPKNTTTP
jgi:hypothetical protein